ncbi:unnamed protein product [Caenorhabditis auriculariae]|uniref:Uncharacterized protein n=1 Tax=Caenorhabditis auriculariae TaxID=2777116 RepID=A0A8S1GYZ5_9PELO|nr:unnamed protein product [Caenorhabditis auriculariae]
MLLRLPTVAKFQLKGPLPAIDRSVEPDKRKRPPVAEKKSLLSMESEEGRLKGAVRSNQGEFLSYDDEKYEYRFRNFTRDKVKIGLDKINLRCNRSKCTGSATLLEDRSIQKNAPHTHLPDVGLMEKRLLIRRLKEERLTGASTKMAVTNLMTTITSDAFRYIADCVFSSNLLSVTDAMQAFVVMLPNLGRDLLSSESV